VIDLCAGCGKPATFGNLTMRFSYPRDVFIPGAADPWNVHGSSPVRTCGSAECEADGLLAAIDEIVTDTAVGLGRLIDREDVRVTAIGRPGDFTWIVAEDAA
jgi:hypothetical protein